MVWGQGRPEKVKSKKKYAISGDDNLRKQSTFRDATAVFPAKWRLRNERRIPFCRRVITQVMGSASDWLRICFYQSQTLPWYIVHRISALVPQPSIRGETSGNFGKCWLFFFSVYLMSKIILILNLSMWICVIRSRYLAKKGNLEWNNTNSISVSASEVIECRRTCSSENKGLNSRVSF